MPFTRGTRYPLMVNYEFSPSDIGGGKFWWKYDTGITIATGVSQWDDQFGKGNHGKQATALDQPSQESDGSVLFDGIRQFIKADAFTWVQPEWIIILGRQITWTNTDRFFDGNLLNTGRIQCFGVTPDIVMSAGSLVGPVSNLTIGAYGVVMAVFNAASSFIKVDNEAQAEGDAGSADMGGFVLGANGSNLQFSNIQVKEVIGYELTPDTQTSKQLIGHLARVGGLSI